MGSNRAVCLHQFYFTCVLNHTMCYLKRGVYRLDESLFDLCRLSTKSRTLEHLILEALFAANCAFLAHTESDLQSIANNFTEAVGLLGLTISLLLDPPLLLPSAWTAPDLRSSTNLSTWGVSSLQIGRLLARQASLWAVAELI